MSKAISRRNFLMATGAVGAAGLLAACGGARCFFHRFFRCFSGPAASADESRPCLTAPST